MTYLTLDAAQGLLMAKVIAQMNDDARCVFWELLPDIIPDLTADLPILTTAVRNETNLDALYTLSCFQLPTILSPEMTNWRQELVMAWEKQLKMAREVVDKWKTGDWHQYKCALRGLRQVDGCGMSSGVTCLSVLPILLNQARDIHNQKWFWTRSGWMSSPWMWHEQQLSCLAVLADWYPGRNVITDPATLKAWEDFWLELYQNGYQAERVDTLYNNSWNAPIILKGIAAKALLNLLETGRETETRIPAGMASLLLESLATAVDAAGEIPRNYYRVSLGKYCHLKWLSWQPRNVNVTCFPTDKLRRLPEILLKKVKLLCPLPDSWWDETRQLPLLNALEELIRWDRAGLLEFCDIDLLPEVVDGLRDYLNAYLDNNVQNPEFLSHEARQWLIRKETANVEGGKELLQKLESHWQYECQSKHDVWYSRFIAWKGRVEMQHAGVTTETPASLQKDMLRAIKKEPHAQVRLALSFWSLEKGTSNRARRLWERLGEERAESDDKMIPHSQAAVLSLLRPNQDNDLVTRREKLRHILHTLPKESRPKLSIAEMTCLMGELPSGNLKADPSAPPDRMWQFRAEETRFCIPMERIASASTPTTIQAACPNGATERIAGIEP